MPVNEIVRDEYIQITAEDLHAWRENPVTKAYVARCREMSENAADVRNINPSQDLVEIGGAALAAMNYSVGIENAIDFEYVFNIIEAPGGVA